MVRPSLALVAVWIGSSPLTAKTKKNKRFKFAVYCSDVSGAFDRVSTRRMLDKVRAKGMRNDMVKVFEAWLAERKAVVAAEGSREIQSS